MVFQKIKELYEKIRSQFESKKLCQFLQIILIIKHVTSSHDTKEIILLAYHDLVFPFSELKSKSYISGSLRVMQNSAVRFDEH